MICLKKIFLSLIFLLAICLTTQVNAACASGVSIGNESVCLVEGSTTKISDGTAYAEGTTLVLNNYNGGNISYFFMTHPLTQIRIKLIGDNYIDESNSYGLLIPKNGIEFIGDGTLTIKSMHSFATVNDWTKYNLKEEEILLGDNVSTIKISVGDNDTENNDTTNNDEISSDTENNDTTNTENTFNNSINLLLLICCIVCVLCTTIIAIFYFKNKRNKY